MFHQKIRLEIFGQEDIKIQQPEITQTELLVEEIKEDSFDFDLFPNPASETINLELKWPDFHPVFVKIINSNGKTLSKKHRILKPGLNKITYDIENLLNGNYYILIEDGMKTYHRPFTVIR